MPFYMIQNTYSREAVQGLIANPQDRSAAVAKLMEAVGGKLHHMFFAFGTDDTVMLAEAPDDKSVAAALLAAASSGSVSSLHTTKLIPMDEAVEAMKLAGKVTGAYKAPME